MDRRKILKALFGGAFLPGLLGSGKSKQLRHDHLKGKATEHAGLNATFTATWRAWPDVRWTGPECWGNRLQDWEIRSGKATCVVTDVNRSLHCLVCQLGNPPGDFETAVTVELLNRLVAPSDSNYIGFRIAAKGAFDDYRSAAVFGEGLDAGITTRGRLFIGGKSGTNHVQPTEKISLILKADDRHLDLSVWTFDHKKKLSEVSTDASNRQLLAGNIALIAHFEEKDSNTNIPSVSFDNWMISGSRVSYHANQTFGPVCFAQYTVHNSILKLNAQLAPVEKITDLRPTLQFSENGRWVDAAEARVDSLARLAEFRIPQWNNKEPVPYRIRLPIPLRTGTSEYFYEGTIATNPVDAPHLKTAVFSCNADYGFPDNEVVQHVAMHRPDIAFFLGDQFYESTGGFGVQHDPPDKACLDYLRKWYLFGWSYRDIFRHIPAVFIPDDHDVYHGNVWGEGGKEAPTKDGWGYAAQDRGGYKMPAEWVNMVQRTQTGHLPDPYNPVPVKQGIQVYYTNLNYGGVSFAILEDRKFKSAPGNVLPREARVVNGFIQNPDFNIRAYYDIDAELLGERQLAFLEHWSTDWPEDVEMKAVMSQTTFCTLATLPEGSLLDEVVPRLPIPHPGAYVTGDAPTTDMDSNGWPPKGRDAALRIIRKCFALHIAGDQHLASVVRYGVDAFGDAGYAFAGPALNNLWPRRWWPEVSTEHVPLPGQPKYTGDFRDGFGNHVTVHAVANPHVTGREPSRIYDRATGYGIVTFNKADRTMEISCWPRFVNPEQEPQGQYEGWPVRIRQQDNYGRKPMGYLPTLRIGGTSNPVIEVLHEQSRETVYALRIRGNEFAPAVFEEGAYSVRVVSLEGKEQMVNGLSAGHEGNAFIDIRL